MEVDKNSIFAFDHEQRQHVQVVEYRLMTPTAQHPICENEKVMLASPMEIEIPANEGRTLNFGISVKVKEGVSCNVIILPQLASKFGIATIASTIHGSGELVAAFLNLKNKPYCIEEGEIVAELSLTPRYMPSMWHNSAIYYPPAKLAQAKLAVPNIADAEPMWE